MKNWLVPGVDNIYLECYNTFGADYWFDEYNDLYNRRGNEFEIMAQVLRYNTPAHGTFVL